MAARIPSPPSHRRPTPDHPPYAEMVQCALKTLAEPYGSTESSISTFIQSNYTSLPWGHSKLLPYYMNKLLIAGEILRSKSDPNYYVLPGHVSSFRKKKPLKKNKGIQGQLRDKKGRWRPRKYNGSSSEKTIASENAVKEGKGTILKKNKGIQGELRDKKGRWRPRKYNGSSSEKTIASENAVKEQKGTILKFKRKCPEGDASASGGGWVFSNNKTHEQEEEVLHGTECNKQINFLLALPALKSSNTKMTDNGCNEKVVELQKEHVKGVEFDMQNENLLASDQKEIGDMKVDVNGKEMPLQEKDYSAIKINDDNKMSSMLQDKNCSLSVIAENGNQKDKVINHMKIDVNGDKMLAFQEKDCSAGKLDANDEVLVLQDKKCSLSGIAVNGEEMLVLQEKDMKGAEFSKQSNNLLALEKDFGVMKNDVNGEEMLSLQQKDTKGVEFDMKNENLLPLQEKDSGNMKIDVDSDEMSAFQEKDMKGVGFNKQNDNMLPLKRKEFGDIETNMNSEEMLALQEKDKKGVELDIQNKNLFPLHEKDSDDMKINVNDDAVMLASKEKDYSTTKIDENDEKISVLQDKNHSFSTVVDNSNESSLHKEDPNVCKNEDKGSLLASLENVEELPQAVPCVEMDTPSKKTSMRSETGTSSKKSKPRKLRKKLWFES